MSLSPNDQSLIDQSLIVNAWGGNLIEVRDLLQRGANVNAKDGNGNTALIAACEKNADVALEILKRDNVDVNVKNIDGVTALHRACGHRLSVVALEILKREDVDVNAQHNGVTPLHYALWHRLLDVALEILNRDNVDVNVEDWARRQGLEEVISPLLQQSKQSKVVKNRTKLLELMTSTSKDDGPIELSLEFIQQFTTLRELGSGAFGKVSLVEDTHLQKKFAVKKIKLDQSDEEFIDKARKTFQKEISALKRFRHPNIIVLYGYNLNVNHADQFLVYEYAANGSLDGFFKDDGMRARLPADMRLSIMFELTRAVHFLHTGGCDGWIVFHRDIKSANICLAGDFTARLVDCGLAKFVPEEHSNTTPKPVTASITNTNGTPVFGTRGYICPEYLRWNSGGGPPSPFRPAYDVYSIGVVLVELVLGCLTGGKRNGQQFKDVYLMYVKDVEDKRVIDGWKTLESDADPSIIWNPGALQLVCKTAIQCITPSSRERLSTDDLLHRLSKAVNLQAGISYPEPEVAGHGPPCEVCNRPRAVVKCSEGHELCANCIEARIVDVYPGRGGCHLSCLKDGCSSHPFSPHALRGRINGEMFTIYMIRQDLQRMWNDYFSRFDLQLNRLTSNMQDVKLVVDKIDQSTQKQLEMLQSLTNAQDRSLAALSYLTAKQFKECPNLVWVSPVSVEDTDLRNPMYWIRNTVRQKYEVVFICAHSGERGHEPFEIEVPRDWIVNVAPWLKVCLQVLKCMTNASTAHGFPFPTGDVDFLQKHVQLKTCLDSLIKVEMHEVLSHGEKLLEKGTPMPIDTFGEMITITGDAFKVIAEKAKSESKWKPPVMVPVLDQNGTPLWVKGEYKKHYNVLDD